MQPGVARCHPRRATSPRPYRLRNGMRTTVELPPAAAAGAWQSREIDEICAALGTSVRGVSADEAFRRLSRHGRNELKEGKPINPWAILLGQFTSLIVWILIGAGVVSAILGEVVDAIAILAIVVLNAVIGFYQECSAEKAIAALKKMTAPRAKVWRNGTVTTVPAAEI